MIVATCYDVLYCLYPNDENVLRMCVGSVTDHEVENVIFYLGAVMEIGIFPQGAVLET